MSVASSRTRSTAAAPWWSTLAPAGSDRTVLALVLLGVALLYLPTYWDLSQTIWQSPDQSQGPLMLLAALWLLFDRRDAIAAVPSRPAHGIGGFVLGIGLVLYVVGRSQSIWIFEVGSQMAVFTALMLLFKGTAALRLAWFPIFFLIFMVPLPGPLVAAVTGPLKAGVSRIASDLLFAMGYPVSRSGVILTVGPYLILVADACAGLTSMFSLEAVGLLYLNIVRHSSTFRNVALSVLVVPIAFCSNVVRVLVLVLVTYHLGDAAGRGFLHGFAGMLLFVVALLLIVAVDWLIGRFVKGREEAAVRGSKAIQ
ncbi:MAG: exosortase B [Rhizobacter sp.]|nr:exosortase B [Rhizobacter sp.]